MQAENLVKLKVSNILNQARPKVAKSPEGRAPIYAIAVAALCTTLTIQLVGVFFSTASINLLAWSPTPGHLQ